MQNRQCYVFAHTCMKSALNMSGCFQSSCVGGKFQAIIPAAFRAAEEVIVIIAKAKPIFGALRRVNRKIGDSK